MCTPDTLKPSVSCLLMFDVESQSDKMDLSEAAVLEESEDGRPRRQSQGNDGVKGVGDCAEEGPSWSAGDGELDYAVDQDDDCAEREV